MRGRFEFGVALAIRFFAVAREEISPAGTHIAGHVLDDDGDGIGFGVERSEKIGVGTLLDGAVAEALVIAEKIASVFGIRGCKLVWHGTILCRRTAMFNRWSVEKQKSAGVGVQRKFT